MYRLSKWLKKYFIPHPGNDHKPHFLRHQSMMVFFLVVIIAELGFLVQVFIVFDKTNFLAAVLPGVLTTLTNEDRADNNVPSLVENKLLDQAAQLKAEDMAAKGYFAHTSPEGKSPWYWFNEVGYRYTMAGENLAVHFFESDDVAKAWMNSPTHRANIVKKEYKEIGIGVASGIYQGKKTVFVAQLFGTPVFAAPVESSQPTPTPVSVPTPVPVTNSPAATPTPVPTPTPIVVPTPLAPAPALNFVAITPTSTQVLGEEEATTNITLATKNIARSIKSFIQKILTSPRNSITYAYAGVGILVILALLLAIFIKSEIRHPAVLVRGFAMIAIIISLLFVNFQVLHLDTVVPTDDITASVIAY